MVKATVTLEDWDDILDTLETIVRANVRFQKKNGIVPLDTGLFLYRLESPDKCGAEKWQRLKQILRQPGPPYLVECEEAGPLLTAWFRATGKDPKARCRLIQFGDTAHVQTVSRGKIYDLSVKLGMPVPLGLERKIYDINFRFEA